MRRAGFSWIEIFIIGVILLILLQIKVPTMHRDEPHLFQTLCRRHLEALDGWLRQQETSVPGPFPSEAQELVPARRRSNHRGCPALSSPDFPYTIGPDRRASCPVHGSTANPRRPWRETLDDPTVQHILVGFLMAVLVLGKLLVSRRRAPPRA